VRTQWNREHRRQPDRTEQSHVCSWRVRAG
jgi:hypothetical protein